jgi:hypothetical protein
MRVSLVPEAPPAHRAYVRVRDGFVPDAEAPGADARRGRGGSSRGGSSRPARRAPAKGARGRAQQQPVQDAAADAPVSAGGRSLASLIRTAPQAAKRRKNRVRKGNPKSAKALRGTQRKAPIAKGQKPGTGVRGRK